MTTKPTMSQDGYMRMTVRVDARLARRDVIDALATACLYDPLAVRALAGMSRRTIMAVVQDTIREVGTANLWTWDERGGLFGVGVEGAFEDEESVREFLGDIVDRYWPKLT